MSVDEIVARLDSLSGEELGRIRRYETQTR